MDKNLIYRQGAKVAKKSKDSGFMDQGKHAS
jgi:hypothetical protein